MLSGRAAKAYVGGAVAALAFAAPVVDDGLTASEALGILSAALVAFQAVFWTSNDRTPAP
jgi:hypothetical protein